MSKLWLIQLTLPNDAQDIFMEGLEEFADSMSCFEDDEAGVMWKLLIYTQSKPDEEELKNSINSLAHSQNIKAPKYTLSQVKEEDWVAKSQENFESVHAGKFFIYPSWRKNELPDDATGIQIEPQRAFGTGGHATTKGCLLALQDLAENYQFSNMLDMGCGSGVLSIAMAKLWPQGYVLAVDNDPVCIETSTTNASINNSKIQVDISDGYNSNTIKNNAPYDLIVSNILSQVLINFAPQAKQNLTPNGKIILAGLMVNQANDVIKAYETQNLKLLDRQDVNDWSILVMG